MTIQEITEKVETQIAKIQPILTAHNGGAEIMEVSEEEVVIGLRGHCAGCPLAPVTFGLVLKKHIQDALPDMKKITFVDAALVEKMIRERTV